MEKLIKNFKGIFLSFKKDNYDFDFSPTILSEKIQKFPTWMEKQIDNEFKPFKNKKIDIDKTIKNLKDKKLLKDAWLVRIKISNNKIKYQNYLPVKFYPRFIRLQQFFKKCRSKVSFPDADFLISIDDSFDNKKILSCLEAPVFCISKKIKNNKVILFPHVEWIGKNNYFFQDQCKAALHVDWSSKINKAFWIGTSTGNTNLEKNERFKIIKLAKRYPDLINASFSNLAHISQNDQNYILENYGLNKNIVPPKSQVEYKYLLAIDGNAFAGSFFWQLFSSSVILKNKSEHLEWYYNGITSDKHYLEYDSDIDLVGKINWLKDNDDKAQDITQNANSFANEHLINESIISYVYKLIDSQSKLLDKNTVSKK